MKLREEDRRAIIVALGRSFYYTRAQDVDLVVRELDSRGYFATPAVDAPLLFRELRALGAYITSREQLDGLLKSAGLHAAELARHEPSVDAEALARVMRDNPNALLGDHAVEHVQDCLSACGITDSRALRERAERFETLWNEEREALRSACQERDEARRERDECRKTLSAEENDHAETARYLREAQDQCRDIRAQLASMRAPLGEERRRELVKGACREYAGGDEEYMARAVGFVLDELGTAPAVPAEPAEAWPSEEAVERALYVWNDYESFRPHTHEWSRPEAVRAALIAAGAPTTRGRVTEGLDDETIAEITQGACGMPLTEGNCRLVRRIAEAALSAAPREEALPAGAQLPEGAIEAWDWYPTDVTYWSIFEDDFEPKKTRREAEEASYGEAMMRDVRIYRIVALPDGPPVRARVVLEPAESEGT